MPAKHIIVTGASRGIGAETALNLAKNGHKVTVISRTEKRLENLQNHFPEHIYSLALDITEKKSTDQIKSYLTETEKRIDGLVHNAGLLINKSFKDQTDRDWQEQMEVNLLAPVRITRELIPYFSKTSHIVNISSMGGYQGSSKFPGLSAYSVSKGALCILSEMLAVELSGYDIRSNSLCLGAVQTEMLEQAFPGLEAPVTPKQMGEFVANFVLNGHNFYNGQVLPVTLGNPG